MMRWVGIAMRVTVGLLVLTSALADNGRNVTAACPHICINGGSVSRSGAVAVVTCQKGFTLAGSDRLVCGTDGKWSDDVPACQREKVCSLIPGISMGIANHSVNHTQPGGTVTFTCDKGFTLQGVAKVMCLADGTWDHASPVCKSQCTAFTHLKNGKVTEQNVMPGGKVKFQCNAGYKLAGNGVLVCSEDKFWMRESLAPLADKSRSGEAPICEEHKCRPIKTLANGRIENYDRLVGRKITIVCNAGYKIEGATVLTCTDKAEWSAAVPTCVRDTTVPDSKAETFCPFFTLENGKCKDNKKPRVAYKCSCEAGYVLRGAAKLKCKRNQEWDNAIPVCVEDKCPSIDYIANGVVKGGKRAPHSPGEHLVVKCNKGYITDSGKQMFCLGGGQWSHIPQCILPSCPNVDYFENGNITAYTNRVRGGELRFTCNPGFTLKGANKVTCSKKGKWSAEFPKCIPTPDCEVPCIENGQFREVTERIVKKKGQIQLKSVTYVCDVGYRMYGADKRKCRKGRWNQPAPLCLNESRSIASDTTVTEACQAEPLDVYVVVDGSSDDKISKMAVKALLERFATGNDRSRVGVIKFVDSADTEIPLTSELKPSEKRQQQHHYPQAGSHGDTSHGFQGMPIDPHGPRGMAPSGGHGPFQPDHGQHNPIPGDHQPHIPPHLPPHIPHTDPHGGPPIPDHGVPHHAVPNPGQGDTTPGRDAPPAASDQHTGRTARIDLGLKKMVENFEEESHSGRNKVCVLASSGRSLVSLRDTAASLHKTDIKIYAIGVGKEIDEKNLRTIVKSTDALFLSQPDQKLDFRKVANEICKH